MPYGNCLDCQYGFLYRSRDPNTKGQLRAHCRRHAPKILADEYQLLTIFPSPLAHLGCGEWEKKAENRHEEFEELAPKNY